MSFGFFFLYTPPLLKKPHSWPDPADPLSDTVHTCQYYLQFIGFIHVHKITERESWLD